MVLLGEPGIGKSREWHIQQARLSGRADHLFLDLGSIDSEETLRREILDSAAVATWRAADTSLTLWLDSLDEGLLHVNVLQSALLRMLRAPLPLDRLRLRILCRDAVWPANFSKALARQLGLPEPAQAGADEAMLTLLLSPLSREQVEQAAEAEGFEAAQFLAAVAAADAQPLAGRPVTLALLLNLYRRHQPTFGLPEEAGRAGLYEWGCLELCERPDQDRPEAHRQDPHQRLLLAGYVAMLGVLTNRRVIAAEPLPGLASPNELDAFALSGGTTAAWRGTTAPITVPALRDLFRHTGLFTNVGQGRLVWAHQSYAEFLAAWYLHLSDLPTAGLRTLFRSAVDPAGGIVPALRETAAWLADLRPDFWNELLDLDPVVLLQADLRRLTAAQRARVVERLVSWLSGLTLLPYQSTAFMPHLAHPGLTAQLAPLLADPHTPEAVARFATDLAGVAQVNGLCPLLVAQALDATVSLRMRERALAILHELADEAVRTALRPLRHQLPVEDTTDELRGHLLWLLWPSHLSVEELLPLLTRRLDTSFYGAYYRFIEGLDPEQLAGNQESLLASLRWTTRNRARWRGSDEGRWQQIALQLQRRAWEQVDDPEVAEALAEAIVTATEDYQPYAVGGTAVQRLGLLARLLPHHRRLEYHYLDERFISPNKGTTLIGVEDWPAVYELLDTPLDDEARVWLAKILTGLLYQLLAEDSPAYTQRYGELYRAAQRLPVLQPVIPWEVAMDWEPEKAKRSSEQRQQAAAREQQAANHRRCWRSINLHRLVGIWREIRRVARVGAAATLDNWRVLVERLTTVLVKRGTKQLYDVATAPRWASLNAAQQEEVAAVAWAVLSTHPTLPTAWYELGVGTAPNAVLLHQALLLLQYYKPAQLDTLPADFWESWGKFLLDYQHTLSRPHGAALLRQAAEAAPQLVEDTIFQLAAWQGRRERAVLSSFADFYRALPGATFPTRLLAAIETSEWRDDSSGLLLVEMLKVDYEPAWEYATQLLAEPAEQPARPHPRPDLVVPVYQWLLFDKERRQLNPWPWWQRLSTEPGIARRVLNLSIYHATVRELRQLAQLEDGQLEMLILWLTYAFALTPQDVDDWEGRPNGRLAAVRTAASFELADRGTPEARDILQRLVEHLGQPFWLRARLDQVRDNLRRNAWEPLPPDALVTLSREVNRRWVRSATDLQELLLESLARFQADLQGEPTTAQVLWFPVKDPANRRNILKYEVHEENYFSNVLRQHLRQDLQRANLLVKREVEIRPAMGRETGQRTDIFVEAFTRSPTGDKLDVVVVVIEVKLSKHRDITTSLEAQLVDYLKDQSYKHGIYLVGWHYGQHDPKPPSKPDLPTLTTLLKQQAAATAPAYTVKSCVLDIRLPADTERP